MTPAERPTVEAVARALWHDHAMQYADVPLEDWSRVEEPYLAGYLREARVAIAAMPTPVLTVEQVHQLLADLDKLADEAMDLTVDEDEHSCESSSECHAASTVLAYKRAMLRIRRAAGLVVKSS